jgi:hypothetical protein
MKHSIDKAMTPMLEGTISQLSSQGCVAYSRQAWKYDFSSEVLCYAKEVEIIWQTWTQSLRQRRTAATACPDLLADPTSTEPEEAYSNLESCASCGFAKLGCEVRLHFGLSHYARRQRQDEDIGEVAATRISSSYQEG